MNLENAYSNPRFHQIHMIYKIWCANIISWLLYLEHNHDNRELYVTISLSDQNENKLNLLGEFPPGM